MWGNGAMSTTPVPYVENGFQVFGALYLVEVRGVPPGGEFVAADGTLNMRGAVVANQIPCE
jgi:hypothetical protein